MKKILPVLLLSCTCLWAQIPPPIAPGAGAAPGIPTPKADPPAASKPDDGMVVVAPSRKANLTEAELNKVYGKDEINFTGVDINQFLTVYADTVNRTVLRPTTLPGTITLRNQTPLTRREVIQLFDAVLGMNGIVMINVDDKFVKAMPVAEAAGGGAPIERGDAKSLPSLGQYVTHVVQLTNVTPSIMMPLIQPFAKIPNSILPIEGNNILVIRDYAENVKRMLEMIEQVDVSIPQVFVSEVIPIKYALAGDIASALNSLGGGGGGATVGSSGGGGTSRSAGSRGGGSRMGGMGGMGGSRMGSMGVQGNPNMPGGGAAPGGLGAPGGAGSSFTDRLRNIISRASSPTAGGGGDIQIFGETKIIADERTNSLLIYATRQDMDTIKDIISKLDVVLAQVLIESIILGVAEDSNWEFGVSASQDPKSLGPNALGAGVVNNDKDLLGTGNQWFNNNTLTNALSSIPKLGGLHYFGNINQDWNVAIKAIAGDGKTEVIQRPTIMTTHATPGQFFVGNTVPYVTSTYYGGYGGGYGAPSSSYQQLRVGIDLTVTPFINPDGIVVMKIDQAIEEIDGYTKIGGDDVPKTASRTLSADVTVRDRDTIVLGGFLRSSGSKTKSGVPLLKDIPLLGPLFRSTSDLKERRELLVLMRPTVLKTPDLAAIGSRIEQERMPGINKFQNRLKKENEEFGDRMKDLDEADPNKPKAAPSPEEQQTKILREAVRGRKPYSTASQRLPRRPVKQPTRTGPSPAWTSPL